MKHATITVTPPAGNNGTGWVDIDVTGTALDPLAPGDAVILNPDSDAINLATFGAYVARVSAANTLRVGVRLLSAPVDIRFSVP